MRSDHPTVPEGPVLVVGFGSIGRRHAQNLRALGVVDLRVFDADPGRRSAAREAGAREYDTLDAALDGGPAAVLVCTPPAAHLQVAIAAAERGCHLFIEKPLADRLDGVGRLQEICQRQQLVTMVACNLRFHPGLRMVKQLVDEGVSGHLVTVRAEFGQYLPDWHPGEDYRTLYSARAAQGGGVILDAIHEFDYCRWIGGEINAVACFAGTLSSLEVDTEDVAAALLRFAAGAFGEIHVDYVQRAYRRHCAVIGDGGTILWDYPAADVRWYAAGKSQWHSSSLPEGWSPNDMYLDEVRHFLDCVASGRPTGCDLAEGLRVLEIALAARRAAAEGRTIELRG